MLITLWITPAAWGWGARGHIMIAEFGALMMSAEDLNHCHMSASDLAGHVNDPDTIWREQHFRHTHEAKAHFITVSKQPADWRMRREALNPQEGVLVYRILDWIELAKADRRNRNWSDLQQKLYGLAHYLGDLTQPLHLVVDYDGVRTGLPGVHAQFEGQMIHRYESKARQGVRARLLSEKIPALWNVLGLKTVIFNVAEQSAARSPQLFAGARPAFQYPKFSPIRRFPKNLDARFKLKVLWKNTGSLAMDQLALGAKLVDDVFTSICH